MELTDLRHFANVAVTASFSRGARLSNVTAPAVSKSVRKLEDELGSRLFERTTRRVALTPAGKLLLARCERIFGELTSLRAELAGGDAPIEGELRVAAMEVLSIELLPRALASLVRAHPRLRPSVFEMVPEAMCSTLLEGRIEVGLTIGGNAGDGIDAHEIGRCDGVLVCGRSHPLYAKKRVVAKDVLRHPSIVPRFLGFEHAPVLDQFPENDWPRRVGATIELLQMGVRLAEEGAGLGYFPIISVRSQLEDGRLRALAGLPRRSPFVLRAFTRAGAPTRPVVRLLIEELRTLVHDALEPPKPTLRRTARPSPRRGARAVRRA
jgi:DNA-binding transcriptional LysR family regulator